MLRILIPGRADKQTLLQLQKVTAEKVLSIEVLQSGRKDKRLAFNLQEK